MCYSRDKLPIDGWQSYRKRSLTRAVRIIGPFIVTTREGPLECEDGYLALDNNGDPYPIAADVFATTYTLDG
jgi:hypothetical protein